MYRLLIVDDEEIIADGLYEFFGNIADLELDVYKAYSAEEALEWLCRTRIDIVLTDIHMPGMDGLVLMERIRSRWPACRIVFLTGYDDFGYVYRAIQQPGVRYILKSEDYDRVIDAVRDQVEEIRRALSTEDLISRARKEMHTARELLLNDYFTRLINGDPSAEATPSQFQRLDVQMRADRKLALLIARPEPLAGDAPYADRVQRQYAIRLVLGRYLGDRVSSFTVPTGAGDIAVLIQPRSADPGDQEQARLFEGVLTYLKGVLDLIQAACRASADTLVSLALSEKPFAWTELPGKYQNLTLLLGGLAGPGDGALLTDCAFGGDAIGRGTPSVLPEEGIEARALEVLIRRDVWEAPDMLLESGQSEAFMEWLKKYTALLRAVRSRNSGIAIEAYSRIALRLLSYVNRRNLTEALAFRIAQNQLMRFDSFTSWGEAADYLETFASLLFELRDEEGRRRVDTAADYIRAFVLSHLGEDLSLVRLAEEVYLNPSYLSRLFKQSTGYNLSEFIEGARARAAKEMLVQKNVRIQDVARFVGYDSAASFTRFFRKAVGMSPQDYRSAHLSATTQARKKP